jgi:hypothetical protein
VKKALVFASVFALGLSLGLFAPQAEAKKSQEKQQKLEALVLKKLQLKEALAQKKLLKLDFASLKHNWSNNYKNYNNHRSVPVPETFLLLGGPFAGLVWWRSKQYRTLFRSHPSS